MPKLLQREEVIQNHPAHSDVMPGGVDPQPFAKLAFLFSGGDRWRGHPTSILPQASAYHTSCFFDEF